MWFVLTVMIAVWVTAYLLQAFVPGQRLQSYEFNATWLNRHYGYQTAPRLSAYRAADTRYTHARGVLYREQTPVIETMQKPVGAVLIGEQHLIAMQNQLWVFSDDGRLVNRLELPGKSATVIHRIGVHYGLPVIQTSDGMWRGDPETWRWDAIELFGVSWSEPVPAPVGLVAKMVRRLTLQQLLSDVISGRILNPKNHR